MNVLALILIFLLVSLVCFFALRFMLIFQVPETNYAKLEEMNSICKVLCLLRLGGLCSTMIYADNIIVRRATKEQVLNHAPFLRPLYRKSSRQGERESTVLRGIE